MNSMRSDWTLSLLILRRLLFGVVTLLVVSLLVFVGTEVLPGDVAEAILGQGATPETIAVVRKELNLDRPAYLRYLDWIQHLVSGNLGNSLVSQTPIWDVIAPRLPNTLMLGGVAALIAVPLAVGMGLFVAMRPGRLLDRVGTTGSLAFVSAPEFLVATVLVLVFAVQLRWVPAISRVPEGGPLAAYASAMALPVLTLAVAAFAPIMRMTRSALLNVMSQPSIEMAILKGVPRHRIIVKHALPNAVAPIINVIAVNLAYIIGGVVVVEQIFSFPGLARLMVDGVSSRDIPLVQVCAMFFCSIYVVLNLVADIISVLSNPRLRHPK